MIVGIFINKNEKKTKLYKDYHDYLDEIRHLGIPETTNGLEFNINKGEILSFFSEISESDHEILINYVNSIIKKT
jgi:hypothetical protein